MFSRDLSYAVRTLRKNPVFTLTAIVTVALGIGASTAIFSVVNGVLLRPLPYANADRLALIKTDMLARNVLNFPIAPGNVPDLKQHATAFADIAAASSGPVNFVADDQQPEQIINAGVTTNFFTTLGARIPFGRNFAENDGTPPPPPPAGQAAAATTTPPVPLPTITILSYGFWQRRFGGDSSVIGKTVQINNGPAQIVGVASPDFRVEFPTSSGDPLQPDVYTALRVNWSTASRINVFLRVFGRLAPGTTMAEARGQLAKLTTDLQNLMPIMKTANAVWRAEPMQADVVKDVRPAVLSLMGAVLFVLLIACANVANLLLVRASSRERELAVRAALGGDQRALMTQMLVESIVIAGGGALVGLALAKLGIALLLRIAPSSLPRLNEIALDPMVLGFTIGLAALSAFIFGMLPAIRASRPNLAQTLRAGGRSPGLQGGKQLRNGVVVAEVALSFVLLIGAGLMVRSFTALEHVQPGFDPNGIMTFTAFNTRLRGRDAVRAYENELEQKLRAIPGVTAVTAAGPLPLDGGEANLRYGPQAAADDPSLFRQATDHFIRPGYFAAMRTKVLAGRDFIDADNDTSSRAIIVDDLLAAKMFPSVPFPSVIGKELLVRVNTPEAQLNQIIGVVQHQRHETLSEPGREAVFIAEGRVGFGSAARWAVRTSGDPSRLSPQIRRVVASIDPLVPIGNLEAMSDYIDHAMASTRFALVLIAVFGIVAAVLAAVGLYGVLSTTVRQRTSEIGVRMAFGATSGSIFRLMIGHGLMLSGTGVAVGIIGALSLTGVMQKANLLIGTAPTDPPTYLAIALLFGAIAALASWMPSRRAAALDPNAALREE